MKRTTAYAAIGLAIGMLVYSGLWLYEKQNVKSHVHAALKNSTVRFSNQAKLDIKPVENLSLAEVVSRLSTDISEIENQRIGLQLKIKKAEQPIVVAAVDHLTNCERVLRALSRKNQKQWSLLHAAQTQQQAYLGMVKAMLTPLYDLASSRNDQAIEDVKLADAEYAISYDELRASIDTLSKSNDLVSQFAAKDATIDPALIKAFALANSEQKITIGYGDQK